MSTESFLLGNEPAVRLGIFFAVFSAMALWEIALPRRVLREAKSTRWSNNLLLVALNTIVLRVLFLRPRQSGSPSPSVRAARAC